MLSQWRDTLIENDTKVAWLSLDANDSDLRHFASYLIISLTEAGLPLGSLEFAAYKCLVEFSTEQVATHLISKLSNVDENVVLILDDYYRAESTEVNTLINQLLDHTPNHFRIIISSRSQPKLNVASRVMGCTAFEIDKRMLSFSLAELKLFIGPDVSNQNAEALLHQTEGWAVAVQLATVANKVNVDPDLFFKGKQQYITNYFTEQILDQSTSEERRFLMYSSILEQFNIDLASSVTKISNVQALIDKSPHIRSLLITIDSQQTWFRYHHLFTELLLAKLNQKEPEIINVLHSRASCWFEEHNKIADAVKHARLSGDVDKAAQLFLNAGGWELVLYGGVGLMRNLLRNFTSNDFTRHPRVRLAYVYSLLKDGYINAGEVQFNKIKINSRLKDSHLLVRDMHLINLLLKIYRDELIDTDSLQEMKISLEQWNKDDLLGIAIHHSSLALSAIASGVFEYATLSANKGLAAMQQADSLLGGNYLVIHQGQICLHQADFETARMFLTESIDMANKNFGIDSRLKTNSDINLQALFFWQSPSLFIADNMLDLINNACMTDGWFEIYASGLTPLFEYFRLFKMPEASTKLLTLSVDTSRNRHLPRLIGISKAYRLICALTQMSPKLILLALRDLDENDSAFLGADDNWYICCDKSYALGLAQLDGYTTPQTIQRLNSAIELAQKIEATLYLIRLLVLRATLYFKNKQKTQAFSDLLSAAKCAIRSDIQTPFFIAPETIELSQECTQKMKDNGDYHLEIDFLKGCIESYERLFLNNSLDLTEQPLSNRESEVLNKLALGMANKEIARALDMTNHTVKFHLKNIFKKLDVDKRINAVNKARNIGLVD